MTEKTSNKTSLIVFPFDLFGSGGAGAGAALVADEFREILADNRRETTPTRARVYTEHVRLREFTFETTEDYADWRKKGRQAARQALKAGDFLVWVAGNHLGVLPAYDELSAQADGVLVVQFDAHLDIHHFRDTSTELSHGNFLLHCAGPLPRLVNVGHRELLLPADHVARTYRETFPAAELAVDPGPAVEKLRRAATDAERIFIDLDCDVFDPAYFPAVAQPVPFGLAPALFLRLLDAVWSPKIRGVFVSEFDPARDRDDRGLALLTWLLEYLLLRRYESNGEPGA
ncbi:MAG TPA: arginase family protein [Gemmataceae bacterium]|nr:arginase family protein [Gemmataceae bacterium]